MATSLVESINRFNEAISDVDNLQTFGEVLAGIVNSITFIVNNFEIVISATVRGLTALFLLMKTNIGGFSNFGRTARLIALQIQDDYKTIAGANVVQDFRRNQGRALVLLTRFLSSFRDRIQQFARSGEGSLNLGRIFSGNFRQASAEISKDAEAIARVANQRLGQAFASGIRQTRDFDRAIGQAFSSGLTQANRFNQSLGLLNRTLRVSLRAAAVAGVTSLRLFAGALLRTAQAARTLIVSIRQFATVLFSK